MLKQLLFVGISLVLIIGLTGNVQASPLISASVPFANEDAHSIYHATTNLVLVFGEPDPAEPQTPGIHFEYDPDVAGPLTLVAEQIVGLVVLNQTDFMTVTADAFAGLDWQTDAKITFNVQDVVVFRTADDQYIKIGNLVQTGPQIDFDYQYVQTTTPGSSVPEPSTLFLFGIGIIAVIGMVRRRMKIAQK